ncbi:DUF625-domain-containing protein [Violaceomyces palustris]|uniref:DUF625-domain-containing protein n=1 Tax=Violaceomyces palustris TaxID=1673888 RepID=A0ACD0NWG2_9BASI|nr:DUF625-domain-containing protein [Violaceomyces palustris]
MAPMPGASGNPQFPPSPHKESKATPSNSGGAASESSTSLNRAAIPSTPASHKGKGKASEDDPTALSAHSSCNSAKPRGGVTGSSSPRQVSKRASSKTQTYANSSTPSTSSRGVKRGASHIHQEEQVRASDGETDDKSGFRSLGEGSDASNASASLGGGSKQAGKAKVTATVPSVSDAEVEAGSSHSSLPSSVKGDSGTDLDVEITGSQSAASEFGKGLVSGPLVSTANLPEIPDEAPSSDGQGVTNAIQQHDTDEVEAETDLGGVQASGSPLELGQDYGSNITQLPSMLASAAKPLKASPSVDLAMTSCDPVSMTSTVSRGNYHQCGSARRVKVYELKGETWFDRGTGYCAGVYDETVDEALLVARKEDKCQLIEVFDPDASAPGYITGKEERASGDVTTNAAGKEIKSSEISGDAEAAEKGRQCRFVVVVSESLDSDDILLASKVVKEDVYQRQQDTLVVWTEPNGVDMALSFQESEGCNEVWEFLTEVQKHFIAMAEDVLSESPPVTPSPHSPTGALGMSASGLGMESFMSQEAGFAGLPDPELGNLEEIDAILKDGNLRGPTMREKIAVWLLREDYIKKLIPVFDDAEELEALPSLHLLCGITQMILMLNDNVIFEYILKDDVFLGVVGMLEYDPEFPKLKASYREYLKETARFKQVVEIRDPTILAKIHQTYRLLYLKDVILARVLDDPTFSILNSFIFFHQSDIVNFCSTNEVFLTELFGMLADPKGSEERKKEGVLFIQHLCAMGKQIQPLARMALYRTLTEWGSLGVVEFALSLPDQQIRNAAAEILMTIIEFDANSVRAHVVAQVDQGARPLVSMLIDLLHAEQDLGLKAQMAEALRIIFDVGNEGSSGASQVHSMAVAQGMPKAKTDPDRFLTWVYEVDIARLFSPLNALPDFRVLSKGEKLTTEPRSRSALYAHLCDLLCYMIAHHSFRSQYFVLTSEVSKKIGSLLHSREKHIRLAALRFFKCCLASNNQFTNRHFVKIELFGAILDLVEAEAGRNNLVTSGCLDFFEHMRRENIKPLINHLLERYGSRVRALAGSPLVSKGFSALVLQWEKNREPPPMDPEDAAAAAAEAEEKARRQRDLARRGAVRANDDLDEDSYFNDDSEGGRGEEAEAEAEAEGWSTMGSRSISTSATTGLVPYDDDDEGVDDEQREAWPEQTSTGMQLTSHDVAEAAGGSSPPRLSEKRRREEEEEEDDIMGRLAKRKNEEAGELDFGEGGFVKASSLESVAKTSSKTGSKGLKIGNIFGGSGSKVEGKGANLSGAGGKKISLGLSSTSKKMASGSKEDKKGAEQLM